MKKQINIDNILSKICVSKPYFAFKELYLDKKNIMTGIVKKEQPCLTQSTGMSFAEMSRHLAILGSCALALNEPSKKYYLVDNAKLVSSAGNYLLRGVKYSKSCKMKAVVKKIDKNSAIAEAYILNSNDNILYSMVINYIVFKEKSFPRIFKDYKEVFQKPFFNPYRNHRTFKNINISGNILIADMPFFKAKDCAGHFDDFPMMPVGNTLYITFNTIEKLLLTHGVKKYFLKEGSLNAKKPIRYNHNTFLKASIKKEEHDVFILNWQMFDKNNNEGLNIGKATIVAVNEL